MLARVRLFVLVVAATLLLPSSRWAPAGAPGAVSAQGAAIQAGSAQSYEGILSIVWGDPRNGQASGDVRYTLTTADGRDLQLRLSGQEGAALLNQGKRVVITGRDATAASAIGLAPEPVVMVDSLAPAPGAQAVAPDLEAAVLGTKKVLFLLVRFSDDANGPHAPSFYTGMTNPDTPPAGLGLPATINAFFKKTSNNSFSWIADVGGLGGLGAPTGNGWLTLPQPKSFYAPCNFNTVCFSGTRFTAFNTDAVNAGKAQGINFAAYDNINFVLSNDLDCCAWGGSVVVDGKSFGATWEPPWGQEPRVYSHEMGHSIGLPHSGWVYFAYDSPWDVMSGYSDAVIVPCGSYFSRNDGISETLYCDEPGNGYIAAHRDYLGWFPPANVVTTNTTSSITVSLEGAALPMGGTPKMIKICLPGVSCTPGSGHYFTVEARTKGAGANSLFDNGIPAEGVLIHDVLFGRSPIGGTCFFNTQSGWAVPIDATPGDYNTTTCPNTSASNPGLTNAQFNPGQTYTNTTYGFRVSVISRSGSTFVVSVVSNFDTQVAIDSPTAGSSVTRPFNVSGWAINRSAATGTGVDMVHVYATPSAGGAATFLGAATYGGARGDIGALYGSQFTNSGFTLSANAALANGSYTISAYARNAATASFDALKTVTNVNVSGPVSNGVVSVDYPSAGSVVTSAFEVTGWAADFGSPTGTGVDGVQFYIQPTGAAAPGVFVGTGSYGNVRSDVGGLFGSRFTNSGYHFTITGLGPLTGNLNVYAHSTVTGAYSIVKVVPITVNSNQLMSIDAPAPESTISTATFQVAGWSIDRATATGTGVDALHIYAFPNPGSGQPAIFLGVATIGIARADVGGIYGSRYTPSGYSLTVSKAAAGLTPGIYNIAVVSHSTSGSFNNLAAVRVTIQ